MRWAPSFRQQLTLGVIIIVIVASTALTAIAVLRETRAVRAGLVRLGAQRATSLAHRVELATYAEDAAAVRAELRAALEGVDALGAGVVRLDGTSLAAVGDLPPDPRSEPRPPSAVTAIEGDDRIRVLAPIVLAASPALPGVSESAEEPRTVGAVVLDMSKEPYWDARRSIVLESALTSLAVLAFAIVAAYAFARRSARPVRDLADAAAAVGHGRFDVRVDARRSDEVGDLQRSFNSMAQDLATLDETKRNIVANVSHELRTPLVPIRTFTELLAAGTLGPIVDSQRRACETILRNATGLERLISSLLEFALAYEGRVKLQVEHFDLREVLHEVGRVATDMIKRGVRFTVEIPVEPLPVAGDRLRLERVFANLAGNALKFARDGGSARLAARVEGCRIVVEVSDDGIGIPPATLPRVFDRFFQAEAGATRRYGGVGIGLALVREYVQLHDGEVAVRSTPGEGSTFIVWLPLAPSLPVRLPPPAAEARSAPVAAAEVTAPTAAASRRVLVVDDEPDNREAMTLVLEGAGFEVSTASSGEEAVAATAEAPADVVLLDVAMEGIDGYETCRRIRGLPSGRKMPVALVTAHVGTHVRANAAECGADRVLTKPVEARALIAAIQEMLAA